VNQYLGDNKNNNANQGSTDAYGNPGQEGQYGQQGQYGAVTGQGFGGGLAKNNNDNSGVQPGQFGQEGQYGAVTGKGFGGDLAKGPDGQPGNSAYEGYDQYDSAFKDARLRVRGTDDRHGVGRVRQERGRKFVLEGEPARRG
jgi:hypothetical protein